MGIEGQTPKQNNYRSILDIPLTAKQRKISIRVLEPGTIKEIEEDTGTSNQHIQQSLGDERISKLTAHSVSVKQQKLDHMLSVLQNIIDKEAETPLKYSDKIAAMKLAAELSGMTSQKEGDTYNVGILDLRSASEEQLVKELARIEQSKRSIIDITPKETPTE